MKIPVLKLLLYLPEANELISLCIAISYIPSAKLNEKQYITINQGWNMKDAVTVQQNVACLSWYLLHSIQTHTYRWETYLQMLIMLMGPVINKQHQHMQIPQLKIFFTGLFPTHQNNHAGCLHIVVFCWNLLPFCGICYHSVGFVTIMWDLLPFCGICYHSVGFVTILLHFRSRHG